MLAKSLFHPVAGAGLLGKSLFHPVAGVGLFGKSLFHPVAGVPPGCFATHKYTHTHTYIYRVCFMALARRARSGARAPSHKKQVCISSCCCCVVCCFLWLGARAPERCALRSALFAPERARSGARALRSARAEPQETTHMYIYIYMCVYICVWLVLFVLVCRVSVYLLVLPSCFFLLARARSGARTKRATRNNTYIYICVCGLFCLFWFAASLSISWFFLLVFFFWLARAPERARSGDRSVV